MKKHIQSKQKSTFSFGARFLVFIILASVLSSCGVIVESPVATAGAINELTPTIVNPATQEMNFASTTEAATEMPTGLINIDMDNIIYPPVGFVKEYFEKGEYELGLETIKQWVGVWEKLGVFEGLEIENNSLSPVPLDGRARIVCVDTRKKGEYVGTMLCPPLDLINGGLKAVPEEGNWDETDKPIIVELMGTEGLTTRGKDNELTYQIIDKYTKKGVRYYDINTKEFVEGSYIPLSMEIQENEPVEGNLVCVSKEFCMGGQMDVDSEIGKVFYEKYMDALIHNGANKDYFNKLLNGDISYQTFQQYLNKNDGLLPSGLKLLKNDGHGYVDMTYTTKDPINLSALRTIVIGPKEWHENYYYIVDYLNKFDKSGLVSPYVNIEKMAYFGWFLDENNYLVLVNGALDYTVTGWPFILGGIDGNYVPERDNKIATGHAISFIVYTEKHEGKGWGGLICPFCPDSPSSPQENDISRILGGSLFKVR